ncbi:hypothetical protein DL89DRAFT_267322 [Linderina pennispora]|uniref:Uncharacterized protein n=1 Tax=Linderina pennispora TaxID=61395 RepID=A0A1Y1WA30_9FUNG|nr:uncharacterized protein DL89DRAFT_267322 [Linderina pennispora]ORX70096.1 hypothetical protein DL89DRAFT_267322 [Linderina pennispora]
MCSHYVCKSCSYYITTIFCDGYEKAGVCTGAYQDSVTQRCLDCYSKYMRQSPRAVR